MLEWFLSWLVMAVAVLITAAILPGVTVKNFFHAILVAVVLGILNAFLRPILVILTIPLTIITLGLFLLIINAIIILLVDRVLSGFAVKNFWWALIFSIILTVINWLLQWIFGF